MLEFMELNTAGDGVHVGAGQGGEEKSSWRMGRDRSFQKFSEKQDAQPPLPGFPRFVFVWVLAKIPHHLCAGPLGQDGRKSLLTCHRKSRRETGACCVLVAGPWTWPGFLHFFSATLSILQMKKLRLTKIGTCTGPQSDK